MTTNRVQDFHVMEELNKTITHSLVTTFGLDFLLFEDKKGGDVATIHNVRQHQRGDTDIHLSAEIKNELANKGDYKPLKYDESGNAILDKNGRQKKEDPIHNNPEYKNKGKEDKASLERGELDDKYRNKKMTRDENRQLDHVISGHEIHNDSGRVIAGLNSSELANQSSNFQSTHGYINNLKSDYPIDEFLNNIVPKAIDKKNNNILKNQKKLESMPADTKQQKHEKRQLEAQIAKEKEQVMVLESIDKEGMREADKKAREAYNKQINIKYYTGSKFLKSTAIESGKSGLKMGVRQALGLVLAEIWFEIRETIPKYFKNITKNFTLELFLDGLKEMIMNIWSRVKERFKDIIEYFKNGALAGALSSLTNTIMNIFFTTQKLIGKLLRETWFSLVSAAKILFFNPDNLGTAELFKEVVRILSTGVAVTMGVILNQHLVSLMTFPLGTELAAFISAVVTGLMTIGITYFLDYSELMKKVWSFLDKFKSEAKKTLEYFQKVNAELDQFLLELSKIEFNLSPQDLALFSDNLESIECEYEKGFLLSKEIKKRNIKLPFEDNDLSSTRDWLLKL